MIKFTKSYQASDGKCYPTLREAVISELAAIIAGWEVGIQDKAVTIAECMFANAPEVVDILTTTQTSRPKARAIHGAKKPRKPKSPEQNQAQTAQAA